MGCVCICACLVTHCIYQKLDSTHTVRDFICICQKDNIHPWSPHLSAFSISLSYTHIHTQDKHDIYQTAWEGVICIRINDVVLAKWIVALHTMLCSTRCAAIVSSSLTTLIKLHRVKPKPGQLSVAKYKTLKCKGRDKIEPHSIQLFIFFNTRFFNRLAWWILSSLINAFLQDLWGRR